MTDRTPPRRSRSLLAAGAALLCLAVLGVVDRWPAWTAPETGITALEPVVLAPDRQVRDWVDLGHGVRTAVYLSGLRVEVGGTPVLKSTERAAPVAVLRGRADGSGERVMATTDEVRLTTRTRDGDAVTWGGTARLSDGTTTPLELTVRATSTGFDVVAAASGPVDALVLGLDPRFTDVAPPGGAARAGGSWWDDTGRFPLPGGWRLEVLPAGAAPAGRTLAVDRRNDGSTDLHVWARTVTLRLTRPTVGS